ncbi:hypothetical protein [Paraburkholderia sp. C35]|uniref:hypothetical protein n=1 Tax=Paraburkholderia sp. C35 TaxID=2126993 RepID=UPI0013A59AC9|nr:hypothetical protein [Paraburkholderia sp. C35]
MSNDIFEAANQTFYDAAVASLASQFTNLMNESWQPTRDQIALALDRVYRPVPHFWESFSKQMVLDALAIACPDWMRRAMTSVENGPLGVRVKITQELNDRVVNESFAEDILRMPPSARPLSTEAIFEWLCAYLDSSGVITPLDDTKAFRAAEKILNFVRLLDSSPGQQPAEETATPVSSVDSANQAT